MVLIGSLSTNNASCNVPFLLIPYHSLFWVDLKVFTVANTFEEWLTLHSWALWICIR
jgi:hypothetical protein